MTNDDRRIEHLFLVRMWREPGSGSTQFRGSVQDVSSERQLFVGSAGEVADFIATQMHGEWTR